MATLLHLSDLHLGDGAADEVLGDHKIEVIAQDSRQKRSTALAATLGELGDALQREGRILDAVVVSGDITYRGNPSGFDKLPDALAALGTALPDPSRIVVVPGNHDVTWGTKASSAERYQAFVDGVRPYGYVTPFLEGVDISGRGVSRSAGSPVLTATDSSFVIVALNSANHCGVRVDDSVLRPHLDAVTTLAESDANVAALLQAWRATSLYDIARIDDFQRRYASRALESALAGLDDPDLPVRIAVMHHQLLPITLDEEIKPFEALTNLAQVRDWLALNRFDVVLHGHKHVAALYEDRYVPLAVQASEPWRRVVVSAVGTVGLGQGTTGTIARIVEVDSKLPTLGSVRATAIAAQQPGVPLYVERLPTESHLMHAHGVVSQGVIEGRNSQEVHEQLLARFDPSRPTPSTPPSPLVCRISNPDGANTMPRSYQALGEMPPEGGWFDELVSLWQADNRLSAMQFNHGERIFNMRGIDQFERAIVCLRMKANTSRAVIQLIEQERDETTNINIEFPAFCLIQLFIEGDRLCAMGYFRKQEMRYWWAINAAELAVLQQRALDALNTGRGNEAPLKAGDIITVTALPTSGASVPRVMVPHVDRWVDIDADRLLRMALLVFNQQLPRATDAAADWKLALNECRPGRYGGAADGNPMPVNGLETVARHLRSLKTAFGDSAKVQTLIAALNQTIAANRSYLQQARGVTNTGAGTSQDQATAAFENLERAVRPILRTALQNSSSPVSKRR